MITVITPSIGTPQLRRAIESVAKQTIPVRHVIVADGEKHLDDVLFQASLAEVNRPPIVTWIPDNTGHDHWNGHKIYAHYSPLIETEFVALLDEDNEFLPEHCELLHERAEKYGFAWSYRNIICGDVKGRDTKESIGTPNQHPAVSYRLVDTSCWMFRKDKVKHLRHILEPWSGDRKLTEMVFHHEPDFYSACTGRHTMNYYAPVANKAFYKSIL